METPIIQYQPGSHKGNPVIWLQFPYNAALSNKVKQLPGCKWSQSNKSWYVADTEAYRAQFGLDIKPDNMPTPGNNKIPVSLTKSPKVQTSNTGTVPARQYKINQQVLTAMKQHLVLKAYSPSTITTYTNEMGAFLATIKNTAADSFTVQRLKDYLQYCFATLRLSENTIHSRMNALKFYYEQVLGREKLFWEIPRPKKHLILPKVLGEGELTRLFKSLDNKKHKAILFTAYSAGLRVSEVVRLQLKHIDSDRMQLFIEKSKGKKDRLVMLSPVLLDILRNYIKTAQPRPVKYLFEGQEAGQPYTARSAQRVFQMAKEKAGIQKELGFHSLRHSFATHLLEKGTDVKYIKELLGHFDIKTTERYLHVKKDALINIVSPLDDLWKKEDI
jgi:integrase/recombinase XerD